MTEDISCKIRDRLRNAGYNFTSREGRGKTWNFLEFDDVIGGLAWLISAAGSDLGIDVAFSHDLTLGEKIEVGEAIEESLHSLQCPYSLQAHQIRALHFPSILPVVQWLSEAVITQRQKLASELAHLETKVNEKRKYRETLDAIHQSLQQRIFSNKEAIQLQESMLRDISDRAKKLQCSLDNNQHVPRVMSLLQEAEDLKIEEQRVREDCEKQLKDIEEDMVRLNKAIDGERNADDAELAERRQRLELQVDSQSEQLHSLRMKVASKNRSIGMIHRRLSQRLTQAELLQYERRFVELFQHAQRKQDETRSLYVTHNALTETLKYTSKEANLLDSIDSQLQACLSSSQSKKGLLSSMESLSNNVNQALSSLHGRLVLEEGKAKTVRNDVSRLASLEREYYSLLHHLQELCSVQGVKADGVVSE